MLRKILGRGNERLFAPGAAPDSYAQLAYGNLMLDTLPDRKNDTGNNKALDFLQRVRAFLCSKPFVLVGWYLCMQSCVCVHVCTTEMLRLSAYSQHNHATLCLRLIVSMTLCG
jgi:hypothetical protein